GPGLPAGAWQAEGPTPARATATDAAGNAFTGTAVSFTLDKTAPATASVTTPAGGSSFRAATVPAGFGGGVADNAGGVGLAANGTTLTLQRATDNFYWAGSAWQAGGPRPAAPNRAPTGSTAPARARSARQPARAAHAGR